LPHVSVVGAVATGTHGSGDRLGNLATAVAALEMVCATGDVMTISRGDPGFDGVVVALGALGIVTRVTLDIEPAFRGGFQNWRARRPATRNMQAVWSRDCTMKPSRS